MWALQQQFSLEFASRPLSFLNIAFVFKTMLFFFKLVSWKSSPGEVRELTIKRRTSAER